MVTFVSTEFTVDVDLQAEDATLVGAITPPVSVDVDLETMQGTATTRSDEQGRFRLHTPAGRCRLRIHAVDGVIVTPWITR